MRAYPKPLLPRACRIVARANRQAVAQRQRLRVGKASSAHFLAFASAQHVEAPSAQTVRRFRAPFSHIRVMRVIPALVVSERRAMDVSVDTTIAHMIHAPQERDAPLRIQDIPAPVGMPHAIEALRRRGRREPGHA